MSPALPDHQRARAGFVVGLVLLSLMVTANLLLPDRLFPVTAPMLAPLVAAALCRPAQVAAIGSLSIICTLLLAVDEQLLDDLEGWTRVLLVAFAAAVSLVLARVRGEHERQLRRGQLAEARSLTLQSRLLPKVLSTDQVQVDVTYRPSSDDLVVGGDFMDVVPFPSAGPGAVAFCVGDVTGHDATAAGLAVALRAAWRALALAGGDPGSWLHVLDQFVRAEAIEDEMATLCVGVLNPAQRSLAVASAGHPRPIMLSGGVALVEVEPGPPLGLPVGLAMGWSIEEVLLEGDFALVVYTDGLIEGRRAPGSEERYGEESLTAALAAVASAHGLDARQVGRLLYGVEQANGGALLDDVALVVLAGCSPAAQLLRRAEEDGATPLPA